MHDLACFTLVLTLTAPGCSETSDSGSGGSGGADGVAGQAGSGGGSAGGMGGSQSRACMEPPENLCRSVSSDVIEPCCALPDPPGVQDACTGTESLENPTSCSVSGNRVTYRVTRFEVVDDCSAGFDLDDCNGQTCIAGGLVFGEGLGGVDNGLAASAIALVGVGDDLTSLNQAFSDALCGHADKDGEPGCEEPVPLFDVQLEVEVNRQEDCANVDIVANGVLASSAVLNVAAPTSGDTVCASGQLGAMPIAVDDVFDTLDNAVIRMTLSDAGISHGVLGATADAELMWGTLVWVIISGAGDPGFDAFYDINDDLSDDLENTCNATSGTYRIGGVVER